MSTTYPLIGGIHPPEYKELSNQTPISDLELFAEYCVSLSQHRGVAATPCVEVGQKVLRGSVIGIPTGAFSAAVHAPTSGVVTEISPQPVAHPSGLSALCITISADGKDESAEPLAFDNWTESSPAHLIKHVREMGITGLGGASFPTDIKLATKARINTLIINGTECEPFITSDDMLMREQAEIIRQGIDITAYILGQPERVLVAIEDNKPEATGLMERALKGSRYEVVSIPTKYPSGGEKQLIQILTNQEVPAGQLPSALGIAVQNVGTVAAIKEAVIDGTPLTERVTTVTGTEFTGSGNYRTRIGTRTKDLLAQLKATQFESVIMGGPMMGFELPSLCIATEKSTNCLIISKTDRTAIRASECIRCGACADVCPAQLLPQQLYWYAKADDHDKLAAYNLSECIECGACAYVCPSKIELVQYYRAAKGNIKRQIEINKKADQARTRFEFRKSRLEAAEAEKEAKRLARKKASEAAKKERAKTSTSAPKKPAFDPLAAAKKKLAETKAAESEQSNSRLEKQLKAAVAKIDFIKEQIAKAKEENTSQVPQLESKLAAAELRHKQLQEKQATENNPQLAQVERASKAMNKLVSIKTELPEDERLAAAMQMIHDNINRCNEQLKACTSDEERAPILRRLEKLNTKLAKETATPSLSDENLANKRDRANDVIERARAEAIRLGQLSEGERKREALRKLEQRYENAIARLDKAKKENSEHLDAIQGAADKLAAKLALAKEDLDD